MVSTDRRPFIPIPGGLIVSPLFWSIRSKKLGIRRKKSRIMQKTRPNFEGLLRPDTDQDITV